MNRSPAETASLGRVRGRSSERFQLDSRAISSEAEAEAETPQPPSKKDEGGTQNDDAAAGAGVRTRVEKPIVSLKSVSSPRLLLGRHRARVLKSGGRGRRRGGRGRGGGGGGR
jgi:hypothetical protein